MWRSDEISSGSVGYDEWSRCCPEVLVKLLVPYKCVLHLGPFALQFVSVSQAHLVRSEFGIAEVALVEYSVGVIGKSACDVHSGRMISDGEDAKC